MKKLSQWLQVHEGMLKRDLIYVLLLFIIWRGFLFSFNFIGRSFTAERDPNLNKDYQAFPNNYFLDGWARWDSGWYARIVENGYFLEGERSNVVFFPLYPYLTKGLSYITGNHWVAGLIISNLSLIFALFFIYRIARIYFDPDGAHRSLVYLLLFPTSFFFSAYYTEGLFLLTVSAALYFYLKKRYFWCSFWGFLASMTRSVGVALFIAFLLSDLIKNRFKILKLKPAALWFLLIPMGLVAFMVILSAEVGDPLAFLHYGSGWNRSLTLPIHPFIGTLLRMDFSFPQDYTNMDNFVNYITSLFFVIAPFFLLKKYDPSIVIFAFLAILIPLSSRHLHSIFRYQAVVFPVFFVLAKWGENRKVDRFIVFASSILLGLYNMLFANWFWAG